MTVLGAISVVLAAYLLGSIPSGYLAARLRGFDIRTVGSRNVGATNVFRALGTRTGIAVMAADMAKGALAVVLARLVADEPWPLVAAGVAVAGHVWPVWLRFTGGKGVAVAGGAAIALVPLVVVVLVPVFVLIVAVTRFVSLASIVSTVLFAPAMWALGYPLATVVFGAVVSVAVLWRHRGNMARLARGTELRIDLRRRRGPAGGAGPAAG